MTPSSDETSSLDALLDRALRVGPNERIELRDAIAAHGPEAVSAMGEWLADPLLTRFAVRVVGRVAETVDHDLAVDTLRIAREEATPDQRADIDAELRRLGVADTPRMGRTGRRGAIAMAHSTAPGWMMRTNRYIAEWVWSEVQAGRLRQGWGSQPKQELNLLRHRREQGEPMDPDDDLAWPNRRMLSDEPDGIQIGDLVLTPHLPREWRWSVLRVVGPYRFEISPERGDYGHILPVEVIRADLADTELTPEVRHMRSYPARLRRLTERAYSELQGIVGS